MWQILRQVGLLLALQVAHAPVVLGAQGRVDVVRLPGWTWVDAAGKEIFPAYSTIYKVWRLPRAGGDTLMFGVAVRGVEGSEMGYGGERLKLEWAEPPPSTLGKKYSKSFFAVSLGGDRPRVRKVSEPERLRGEPVVNGYRYIHSYKQQIEIFDVKNAPPGISHAGRDFAKTGKFWASTVGIVSPGGKWLAVFSYTSRKAPTPYRGIVLPTGGEPERGTIHADVYDASAGELVLSGRHSFGGVGPSSLFGNAVWVEDRYLAVPLDDHYRKCMLLTLPVSEDSA
jgi:hypothetical protein